MAAKTLPRDLVAEEYATWSGYEPGGPRAHVLRSLLWKIDHPSDGDQTAEIWSAWLDEVEPRWSLGGAFVHPEWVAKLRANGARTVAEIAAARKGGE